MVCVVLTVFLNQVSHVMEHEVMRLKDTASKVRSDYSPKITFIIVSKRINTRYSYLSRHFSN